MPQTIQIGRTPAARKYDLLTAMGAFALGQGKHVQRLTLRLMTLITARYNWMRDELAVGQREIARLWAVDERTVKREMAKLRAMGWLRVKRQATRGRVTEYSLCISRILTDTQERWAAVGPDFAFRMGQGDQPDDSNIVPMPARAGGTVPAPDLSTGTEWALAQGVLHSEDPALYKTWFAGLQRTGREGARLTLQAPSRFHASYVSTHLLPRIVAACRAVDMTVDEVILQL